jgi:uncharacterized membrane protein (DUF2068 family)
VYRCLRCLDLVELPAVVERDDPTPFVVPARGRALRDAVVLRLIAVDKAVHALLLGIVGLAILLLSGRHDAAHRSFIKLLVAINGSSASPDAVERQLNGVLGKVDWLLRLHTGTLHAAAAAVIGYAALNAVEAVGLWRMRRWAEYLSALATSLFLPIEAFEIHDRFTWFRLGTLVANLAIVGYLVWSKRLFGIRGGAHAEHALRMRDASLDAVAAAVAARRPGKTQNPRGGGGSAR